MLELVEVDVTHVYGEANQLADSIVNKAFKHQGRTQYHHFAQLPSSTKKNLNRDK